MDEEQEIIAETKKRFGKTISEIDRRLSTFQMLLEAGFSMILKEPRPKVPTYILSAKSFRLIRSARNLLLIGYYESCWVLLRAAYEANILGAHLDRCEADARKWLNGEEISMRRIKNMGLVTTWDQLWSSLCDQTHANVGGLPIKPLKLEEDEEPFAFVLTDPPEIKPLFQPDECSHVSYHIDIEICKGAGLQIMLFRNRILDQSMELSDRYAELHKHITRLFGRPDLAKQTKMIEREYHLDKFYRKRSTSPATKPQTSL